MKRLIMIPVFLAGALVLAGCAAQSQEPRVDDSSGSADRPKTVDVYKDDNDAATGQDDSSTSQGGTHGTAGTSSLRTTTLTAWTTSTPTTTCEAKGGSPRTSRSQ